MALRERRRIAAAADRDHADLGIDLATHLAGLLVARAIVGDDVDGLSVRRYDASGQRRHRLAKDYSGGQGRANETSIH